MPINSSSVTAIRRFGTVSGRSLWTGHRSFRSGSSSTVRDNLSQKRPFKLVAFAVAGWMRYVSGVDEAGGAIDVRDPLAALLRERTDSAGPDPVTQVRALATVEAVFGKDLPANEAFMTAVTEAYKALRYEGARKVIADLG